MFNFFNLSIRNKLVLMQVLISFIVVALFFSAFIYSDIRGYKERKVKSTNTIGQIISSSSVSALRFSDSAAVQKLLLQLEVQSDIINATILDKSGNVFAAYTKEGSLTHYFTPPPPKAQQFNFTDGYLFSYNSIIKDNERLGTVCIQVDLLPLNQIIQEEVEIGLILLAIVVGLSFLITIFAQSFITKPLLYLNDVMQSIIKSGDYKKRAVVQGKDEIGALTGAFNEMLKQIEKRDNEMEQRVKERTRELEAANKELESFSYSVSHDMRAPLRAVSGFSNLVTKRYADKLDDDGKDALRTINSEAARMGQLIDDLLAFSRLGKKEVQKARVDMNSLVENAVKEIIGLERGELKTSISLDSITIDKLPDANGDSVLLRQVLINLISNAVKYSGHNPNPKVHIGSFPQNGRTVYYIEDNGVGFDMQYYHKLFGVFQRLHSQPEFSGTGIGLAIVQKIISRHGGKVWAESKLNEGAKFYFSLPN